MPSDRSWKRANNPHKKQIASKKNNVARPRLALDPGLHRRCPRGRTRHQRIEPHLPALASKTADRALTYRPPCARARCSQKITTSGAPNTKNFCFGLPGNFNALTGQQYDFDPWGFTAGKTELEINRLREAELTHGRVSMLASLGFIVQEKFHPLVSLVRLETAVAAKVQMPHLAHARCRRRRSLLAL